MALTNSRFLRIISLLITIFSLSLPAYAQYSGGTGEPNDPYQIATAEDLMLLGETPEDYDKHFILTADIDLDPNLLGRKVFDRAVIAPDVNDDEYWFQGTAFTGVFDGNDHTISHLTIIGESYLGLFGQLGELGDDWLYVAEVKNLGLEVVDVNGTGGYVGGLVGSLDAGTITDCYVEDGTVSGVWKIGGLVGCNSGQLSNCYVTVNVLGDFSVGGLVGENKEFADNILIENCRATGSVEGHHYVGGLVGQNHWSTIRDCCATGNVTDTSTSHHVVRDAGTGGLVGTNETGTIRRCYSVGSVEGYRNVGGLVGINKRAWGIEGTIINCYSLGYVTGTTSVGGLVGENEGRIATSYSTGTVDGDDVVGGLVGSNEGDVSNSFWDVQTSGLTVSDGGTGLTTAEMQTTETFIGWGCDSVWTIDEGADYPRLFWENMPGELITNPSYGGGSGTETDPYLVFTAEHLNRIRLTPCDWDKHFKLMADIDLAHLAADEFNIIGYWREYDYNPNEPFCGVFDGNGFTISNFRCTPTRTHRNGIGLFGYVDDPNAEIKNLGLIDPEIDAGTCKSVGSLVGRLHNGAVTACYAEGVNVMGDTFVGGLVGINSGILTNCYASGNVSGDYCVGGLMGSGGILSGCYAKSSVLGNQGVGGLAGRANTLTNCYATGSVFGNECIGGLVGEKYSGSISSCFWDIQTSGQTRMCGSHGEEALGCDDSYGKTTAEMQTADTFIEAGWDFINETENGTEDIWWILEGQDYPRLWWEAEE